MYKKVHLIILLFLILSSCNNPIGGDNYFSKINTIEEEIGNENWEKVQLYLEELYQYYKKNMWKLQLFGDENEYEGIQESFNRLIITIQEKDKTQALIELVTIKAYLEEIYSF